MNKKLILWGLSLLWLGIATSGCGIWKKKPEAGLSEAEQRAALREMLHLALDRSVQQVRAEIGLAGEEGFGLPPQAAPIIQPLRRLGFGAQIDQVEAQIDQAASSLLVQAKTQLDQRIDEAKIKGVEGLLRGEADGATQWLRQQSQEPLMQALRPALRQMMGESKAAQRYENLVSTYNKLPLVEKTTLVSLEDFLLDKLLDRIFALLAREEREIRQNPAARNSPLLQAAFATEIIPTQ